jgi:hypothetical protein
MKKKDLQDLAHKELSSLSFPGDWMTQEINQEGESLSRSFRNSDFYTDREGEEDDDWANFTGERKVIEIATRHFSQEVLDNYDMLVEDEGEKCWFYVELRKKERKSKKE